MNDVEQIILAEIKEMKTDIKTINNKMGSIEKTVAVFGSFFGLIGAYIQTKFLK